jgi:hypothetical protein
MFALPGLIALVLTDFLRPQEHYAVLRSFPLLYVLTAAAALGFVLDLRLGLSRLRASPHLVPAAMFFLWCFVTIGVRVPDQLLSRSTALLVPLAIYLLVSHAIQTFRMLEVLAATLVAVSLVLAAIGVHLGTQPFECRRDAVIDGFPASVSDGRQCKARRDCEGEGAEPGLEYACERGGVLDISTLQGRVRYRGTLEDPNVLSMVLGAALPLALTFLERRRSVVRALIAAAALALFGLCAIMTQSRGGQLVFLAVLAVFFVRRVGVRRGLLVGVALALPMLLLGGRSGAEDSSEQRVEAWWVGLHLLSSSPGFGAGSGQFTDYHYLTAHNSFVLAAAELGLPGLFLWTTTMYTAVKVPLEVLRARAAPVASSWALGLVAAMSGLLVGMFFLSYNYATILWIYVGLTGVLYQAVVRHSPEFRVRIGARDLATIAAIDAAVLVALLAYTGVKLGW